MRDLRNLQTAIDVLSFKETIPSVAIVTSAPHDYFGPVDAVFEVTRYERRLMSLWNLLLRGGTI